MVDRPHDAASDQVSYLSALLQLLSKSRYVSYLVSRRILEPPMENVSASECIPLPNRPYQVFVHGMNTPIWNGRGRIEVTLGMKNDNDDDGDDDH